MTERRGTNQECLQYLDFSLEAMFMDHDIWRDSPERTSGSLHFVVEETSI